MIIKIIHEKKLKFNLLYFYFILYNYISISFLAYCLCIWKVCSLFFSIKIFIKKNISIN